MKVLVTGARGFVGTQLSTSLSRMGWEIYQGYRNCIGPTRSRHMLEMAYIDPKGEPVNETAALYKADCVVHLAARVHVMKDVSADPLAEFRRINVQATIALARQAVAVGVKRMVYLSSIKVNGQSTKSNYPFTAIDTPCPTDFYSISKLEAEASLLQISAETGLEVVIVRPPMIYGPGVKANFEVMMRWLAKGIPLPLAAVTENRRSLVALDNLVDLIITCVHHPAAANQVFLVSDGEDLSTADLLRRLGVAQATPARLFYAPTAALKLAATFLGKQSVYERLCGSLQIDASKTIEVLGWKPPITVDEGLRRATARMCR